MHFTPKGPQRVLTAAEISDQDRQLLTEVLACDMALVDAIMPSCDGVLLGEALARVKPALCRMLMSSNVDPREKSVYPENLFFSELFKPLKVDGFSH